jgi:hypothetical protein
MLIADALLCCRRYLSTFAANSACQLDVLGHDRHTLGVDGAQIRVFEQTDEVGFAGLLKGHDGRTLEAKVGLEVLGNLADEALERQLADQQLRALLVTTDLTQGDGAGPVTMGLLDSSRGRCTLAGRLGRQLLPRGLASGRFTRCLLRSCHRCGLVKLRIDFEREAAGKLYIGWRSDDVASDWSNSSRVCSVNCIQSRGKLFSSPFIYSMDSTYNYVTFLTID